MERTLRAGVSRNTAVNASQQILRGFYLLRCNISADARQATKAVQSHFPMLQRATRMLSPLSALSADRTLRPVDVKNTLARDIKTISDYALICHHPVDLPSTMTATGLDRARFVVDNLSKSGADLTHVLPANATTYSPAVLANTIARMMAGFIPIPNDDYSLDGNVDLLAAELVPFSFVLPYMISDSELAMVPPPATCEEMLDSFPLLNRMDASFGIESKSDQRMTKDAAEMSSRSLNELPQHERRGRMPWKIMLTLLAVQLKHELDNLGEQRAELQSNSHVTTFGGKLFQQMSIFVPIDSELLQLSLAIKEMGFAMNPAQVYSKWQTIRAGTPVMDLNGAKVEVKFGSWTLKRGDETLLTVRPAKMA
ncbi:sigma NS [Pycnonotidae orthoreovirus]|uniref:Sigma NS n=1 Tax=Pycnonotidae orthoreovirus TaxID=3070176 RepID=A0A0B6VII0_9REOV|nr:sigma NS [Avian orthoreovirus]BAQ19504.1 sigma NS [Avian orthoreovirus]